MFTVLTIDGKLALSIFARFQLTEQTTRHATPLFFFPHAQLDVGPKLYKPTSVCEYRETACAQVKVVGTA
jgi:hypothetical protein